MKTPDKQECSPALLAHLRNIAGGYAVVSFRDFMQAALYAPGLGYYARAGVDRVGRRPDADFYTSSSLGGGLFGRLLRASAAHLLAPESPAAYSLLEVAAEPEAGIFGVDAGGFAKVETRRLGDSLIPPKHAAVFANEWLDAQPFHRLEYRRGAWRELGVRVDGTVLVEAELDEISTHAKIWLKDLPREATEDYHLDLSLDAENLLRSLASASWKGCLMLADYGHDWATLIHERPAGTARAYFKHQASADLLARPGAQDITCHVCWDRLENILRENGFESVRVEHQEAFFVRHAANEIEALLSQNPGQFSRERATLLELLHPAHLGRKFQILSAIRR